MNDDSALHRTAAPDRTGAAIRFDDWQLLFGGVSARLHAIVTADHLWRVRDPGTTAAHPAAALVRECALALDSLRTQLCSGLTTGLQAPSPQPGARSLERSRMDPRLRPRPMRPAGGWRVPLAATARMRLPADDAPAGPHLPDAATLQQRIDGMTGNMRQASGRFVLLHIVFAGLDAAGDAHARGREPQGWARADSIRRGLRAAIAARLAGSLRQQDVVLRCGPDGFCCLLVEPGIARGATRQVSDLVSAVSLPFAIDGERVRLLPAFGVATFPDDGCTAADLLRVAGAAIDRQPGGYALLAAAPAGPDRVHG